MTTPILHHYDLSPFAEKVRTALGHKGVVWASVEAPIWPPRPHTVPLTAGYRRIPVLQFGADIYCDTALILDELDRRYPDKPLYPMEQRGAIMAFARWADMAGFMPAATLTTSIIGDGVPAEFIADRIAFMHHDFSRAASMKTAPLDRQRVASLIDLLAQMLADGRPFLFGETLTAADLAAWHPLWFARSNGGAAIEALLPFDNLSDWMERIAAFGHGQHSTMTPTDALSVARDAQPIATTGVRDADPSGLAEGDPVLVIADEANDPIRGTLVAADTRELVIANVTGAAGTVHVHLPRLGFSAVRDEDA
ncbi:glutathione S-transferase family protein [Sphingomonas sp. PB1R3]|uniref:glutathione S-transferase family protein n=1 Tax=Sphingomonas flavida TaxID=3096154 RepID=UPI002FC92B24